MKKKSKRKQNIKMVEERPRMEAAVSIIEDIDGELVKDMASFTRDPYKFVLYSFPWGEVGSELEKFDGPDTWQTELLCKIRDGLLTPYEAIRIAVASGHGIGKGAFVAWIILWAMATCVDTRGVVTANTDSQLRTKTWAEVSKWHRLFIAKHWFSLTATALASVDKEHERTWRIDIIPWSENNTEAFAGLHNAGRRIVLIFDEASAIADKIWEVSEGALTDEGTEIIWVVLGNPTRNIGRFKDCFGRFKHRWFTRQIDSRDCKMTNKALIAQWVTDYGEDSDFVKVRARGEFPNVSDRQWIPTSFCEDARRRVILQKDVAHAARIIGVDMAWTGGDGVWVTLRQGNYSKLLAMYPKNDDDFVMAGYIANWEDTERADAVFIDFGYGTGVASAGKQLKREWMLVPFGGGATSPKYLNKRANMWGDMKDWLQAGGMIPDKPEYQDQLCSPEYIVLATGKNAGKICLESKTDMKARGVGSPGFGDSLALTFAFPVAPKNRLGMYRTRAEEFVNQGGDMESCNQGKKYDVLTGVIS